MQFIASFDIGTTSIKGVLVGQDGSIHGENTGSVSTFHGASGIVEQDPEQWWNTIINIVHTWWNNGFSPHDVRMIVLSGQMQDCIPVGADGKPTRRAVLYSDDRAGEQAQKIKDTIGEQIMGFRTFNRLNGQMTFSKMLWVLEKEPEVFGHTNCFLVSSKDYIIRQLTGKCVTDPTSGATTGMMDLVQREWVPTWLSACGIELSKLPVLLASDDVAGFVLDDAALQTGFQHGTPVLCGVGDAGASTIGAGAAKVGVTYAYLGTTGWVAVPVERVYERGNGIFQLTHPVEDLFIAIAPLMNAGNAHQWIASVFGDSCSISSTEAYAKLEEVMRTVSPGSNGVLFLPYLNGERCPVEDFLASGSFSGLRATTTWGDMCRSVLEGVAMALRQVMELLLPDNKGKRMTLIGGGSRSNIWCQIIADVCGTDVFVPEDAEFLPSLGAASAAFVSLGWAQSYNDFVDRWLSQKPGVRFTPNQNSVAVYTKVYEKWQKLYPALKSVFAKQ